MKKLILFALLLTQSAFALYDGSALDGTIRPDNGWYYKLNEGGIGLNIEIQEGSITEGGFLFGAAFVYDADGNPTWYTFSGEYQPVLGLSWAISDGVIGTFSGSLDKSTGGQCIGCDYTPNQAAPNDAGDIVLRWKDNRNLEVTWGGHTEMMTHGDWHNGIGENHIDWIVGEYINYGISSITRLVNGVPFEWYFGLYRDITTPQKITRITDPQFELQPGWENDAFYYVEEGGFKTYILRYSSTDNKIYVYRTDYLDLSIITNLQYMALVDDDKLIIQQLQQYDQFGRELYFQGDLESSWDVYQKVYPHLPVGVYDPENLCPHAPGHNKHGTACGNYHGQ
ncbi:MAG: hypothetical protein ACWA5R_02280 [bacterium]